MEWQNRLVMWAFPKAGEHGARQARQPEFTGKTVRGGDTDAAPGQYVRLTKVLEIRQRLEEGSYSVPAIAIADRLLAGGDEFWKE